MFLNINHLSNKIFKLIIVFLVYIDFKPIFVILGIGRNNCLYFDYTMSEENYLVFPEVEYDTHSFDLSQAQRTMS